ncbi:hypothetical protein IU433_07030 [Nocardia puris]|uniref:Uncharacterized protein n=1 Tax=Nocardia puris TaxID=208602 RepID=A0A366DMW0_9NOCA|nr:hypothetical protein [Nocardia puris]MBF6211291.1 hypothetical protein [Nocardia puris]MBF6365010.1 hypothetical protein [Nocardia puris]MBF6458795.1 hypothetical protein [Nocardia puris]RBO90644.1 hypothetical protein DFR74_10546 [Nocardia puris]
MAITATEWLITSDVALEAAFRIDLPEPHSGRWVLSYLPTAYRLTRAQALAGIVLAEMILLEQIRPSGEFDRHIAALHAAELGLTVQDVLCLLALRAPRDGDPAAPDPATTAVEGSAVVAA